MATRSNGNTTGLVDVDAYPATLSPDVRAALEDSRGDQGSCAGRHREHQLPGPDVQPPQGPRLHSAGRSGNRCAFYVRSLPVIRAHAAELEGWDVSGATIHYAPEKPLPAALVAKLVKARITENG